VLAKVKQGSLIVCLFLFLFVVIGGGLHLSPGFERSVGEVRASQPPEPETDIGQ